MSMFFTSLTEYICIMTIIICAFQWIPDILKKLRYYLWLFLQVALSHIPPLRVLEVHLNGIRGITIHITVPKIHISYSENNDSTLFFYYFNVSPVPTLAHTIAKGTNYFFARFSF
jgi:hypothetical protein